MTRDPRFGVLFEPVRIGRVVAKSQFYQVSYCTGMGFALPSTVANRFHNLVVNAWWIPAERPRVLDRL